MLLTDRSKNGRLNQNPKHMGQVASLTKKRSW